MSERVIQWGVLRPGDDWPAHLAVAGAGSLDKQDARRIARNYGTVAVCREVTYGDWAEPSEPVCTCPSGDGSLRWPCPTHPPTHPTEPEQRA